MYTIHEGFSYVFWTRDIPVLGLYGWINQVLGNVSFLFSSVQVT